MTRSTSPSPSNVPAAVTREDIDLIVAARHPNIFSVLGPHPVDEDGETRLAIRAFVPGAVAISVLSNSDSRPAVPMTRMHDDGFFATTLGPVGLDFRYRLLVRRSDGHSWETEDPYRFGRVLTDYDLHLFGEGTHLRNFEKLGAHVMEIDGISGVHFALWAPNAERVSVVGPFNDWDGRRHALRCLGSSGLWETFIPGVSTGDIYKFEIRSRAGDLYLKSDPYATYSEFRPGTASIVYDTAGLPFRDEEWMQRGREARNAPGAPVSIYEVHLGSWRRGENNRYLSYRELADTLVPYVRDMGFSHIELLPILEHPFDGSWGYQPLGYFSPTSRFGTPHDFAAFVNACHEANIGVILDWVPAHFPRDDHGLRLFDGTHLYEHADPRQGEHRDWGTLIFNYGRNEVSNFLLGNALYWLEKYHMDGLRVDAVASMLYLDYSREEGDWIPNRYGGRENIEAIEFIKRLNGVCHSSHPGILTIAEESTAWPGVTLPPYLGGLGFNLKWNMGWMNDMLYYFSRDPVHRRFHHHNLTFSLLYAFSENFVLPLSHDEVVHGKRSLIDKMPGDASQKFANLRLLFGLQYTMPGKKLLFMGCEFGQGREWTCEQSLDWHLLDTDWHASTQRYVKDLNYIYRQESALHALEFSWGGFDWIDFHDQENSIISFLRRSTEPEEEVVVALNFTPVPRSGYRIGVPHGGYYREILNSDAEIYCGSNMGNAGGLRAERVPHHGRPWSLQVTLPPLAVLIFKRSR